MHLPRGTIWQDAALAEPSEEVTAIMLFCDAQGVQPP